LPLCSGDQIEGKACSVAGEECALPNACGAHLRCTDRDPKPPSCPISSSRFKDGIEYVNQEGLEKLASEVEKVKLARYHYKADPKNEPHLGFIIEDQPNSSPAVEPNREHVDLYGYMSMAVAALQVQQKQLAAQKAELEAARREITELKRVLPSKAGAAKR
jgi:hypothetical protein